MEEENALSHVIIVGDPTAKQHFAPNSQTSSVFIYIRLLWKVVVTEILNFYSVYFIILGYLQSLPDLTTTNPLTTFFPVGLYILLTYFMQAIDLSRSFMTSKLDEGEYYSVTRDFKKLDVKSKNLRPGDIFTVYNQNPLPCDCILLSSSEVSIAIDTAMLDGETNVKDRYPIPLPKGVDAYAISQNVSIVKATNPRTGGRTVNGTMCISTTKPAKMPVLDTSLLSGGDDSNAPYITDNETIFTTFNSDHFVERGSIIRSSGSHDFMVIYTGIDCRSSGIHSPFANKNSLIDVYLEKLAVIAFCLQFTISLINGLFGAKYHVQSPPEYVRPIETSVPWQFVIIIARNYLLLSFMIPITLKLVLPIFRLIYGLYISWDSNLVAAKALNTTAAENLGSIDVIVTDKTGTLTKNKLKMVSAAVVDTVYDDLDDPELTNKLAQRSERDFVLFWKALSVCHSVKIETDNVRGSSADETAIIMALIDIGFRFSSPRKQNITVVSPLGDYGFEILRIIPFNRKRMTMSIVARDSRGTYVFTKGASDRVIRNCTTISGDAAGRFEAYNSKGLRTLSYSYKEIEMYEDDMSVKQLESFHRLLGTVAIEDSLQDDVQLSIDMMHQAGVQIWVSTGDAPGNTAVTVSALGLIRKTDAIVEITDSTDLDDFIAAAMRAPENSFSVMFDCETDDLVHTRLESEPLVQALLRARCVVFYRCKPSTKAAIASSLRLIGKRVLAIGDGANDGQLLRSADVGIAIIGGGHTESCDFAITSFRHICRLLLVHGHASLQRSVLAVHFSFYKAALFAGCQAIYQIWTGFSGLSFFGPFSLLSFNVLWTMIPMIAILFDKDISDNYLLQMSFLYRKLQNPLKICWSNMTWLVVAIYQSTVIMMIAYYMTGESFTQQSTGRDLGKDYLALLVYFALVIIITFYLLYSLNTLTYYSFVAIFGNLLLMVAMSAIAQVVPTLPFIDIRDWAGFYGEVFSSSSSLILLLSLVLAAVTPSWLFLTVWTHFNATEPLLVIEKETLAAKDDEPLFFSRSKSQL